LDKTERPDTAGLVGHLRCDLFEGGWVQVVDMGGKSGGRVGSVEGEVNLDHPIKRDNIFMAKANTRFSLKFIMKLKAKKKDKQAKDLHVAFEIVLEM
jgi:hypothetical protein